ncbi:probable E3 ubiquitin-protein ligase LUL4 [Humulus lupulus]|uniref:probable E3 ubiquitin-protein ligase LUL4 n=1 Tax=Humulus lupulus TaxID=3486 RepID=UPI002B4177B0|nr:probable E3 ubiquitin-protein ligase LUL4 [Humulus lupulus]
MGVSFSRDGRRRRITRMRRWSFNRNHHQHNHNHGDHDQDQDQDQGQGQSLSLPQPSSPSTSIIDPSPSPVTSSSSPSATSPPPPNSSTHHQTTTISTNTTTPATAQVDFSFPSLNLQSSSSPSPTLPPPSPSSFVFGAPHPNHHIPNPFPSNNAQPRINAVLPPPFASAKRIKNNVNVHKGTIKLNTDAHHSHSFLLSFTFDALVDGSITIFYFAKEELDCTFTPLYPQYYMPMTIPFQKGLGQKFFQPSGTGIEMAFIEYVLFEMGELANSSSAEDILPLVIYVEAGLPPLLTNLESIQPLPATPPHSQITQAVIEHNGEGQFLVKVINQILWINGVRYELHELYGFGNSDDSGEPGKECIICMTQPKDVAVLPCRHMCMCSECAQALTVRSKKCPICRQLIKELIQIKIDKA